VQVRRGFAKAGHPDNLSKLVQGCQLLSVRQFAPMEVLHQRERQQIDIPS
jgi:hypothetical protein